MWCSIDQRASCLTTRLINLVVLYRMSAGLSRGNDLLVLRVRRKGNGNSGGPIRRGDAEARRPARRKHGKAGAFWIRWRFVAADFEVGLWARRNKRARRWGKGSLGSGHPLHWQTSYGRLSANESHRLAARNAGSDDPTDAAVGTAARARDRASDPGEFAGRDTGGARLFVSGAAPAGTTRVAGGGVEDFRGKPACPVLPADSKGQEAAC